MRVAFIVPDFRLSSSASAPLLLRIALLQALYFLLEALL
jgi:hypothetical protein